MCCWPRSTKKSHLVTSVTLLQKWLICSMHHGSAFIHTMAHPVAQKTWFRHFYVGFPAKRVDNFANILFSRKMPKLSRNFYFIYFAAKNKNYEMRKFPDKTQKFCKKMQKFRRVKMRKCCQKNREEKLLIMI